MSSRLRGGKLWWVGGAVLLAAVVVVAVTRLNRPRGAIHLRDVTGRTGIAFRHTDGGSGRRYIVETVTAGLALFDYNGDGLIDVYFINGAPLRGTKVDKPPTNALYRNDGRFRFADVTALAGVGDTGFGLGPHDRVDRVEVRWIGGGADVLENVDVDQLLPITEGSTRTTGTRLLRSGK
jgi:hypothetical protein